MHTRDDLNFGLDQCFTICALEGKWGAGCSLLVQSLQMQSYTIFVMMDGINQCTTAVVVAKFSKGAIM